MLYSLLCSHILQNWFFYLVHSAPNMSPLSLVNIILSKMDTLFHDFNHCLCGIQFQFQSLVNSLKSDIGACLEKEINDDSFITISLLDVNNRIKLGGASSPSKVLCASLKDISEP